MSIKKLAGYIKTFISMADDKNKIVNVFGCNSGNALTDNASPYSVSTLRVLNALYPEVVKESKFYDTFMDKWFDPTSVEHTTTLEYMIENKMIEDQVVIEKPFNIILAEKYINLHKSAMRRGKEFNLDIADVRKLLKTKKCFYTGVTLTEIEGDNYQRTVDRIDNTRGYVKGNVVACSHLANQIKNELFERPTSNISTNITFVKKLLTKLEVVA
jgi:hypothetical protein